MAAPTNMTSGTDKVIDVPTVLLHELPGAAIALLANSTPNDLMGLSAFRLKVSNAISSKSVTIEGGSNVPLSADDVKELDALNHTLSSIHAEKHFTSMVAASYAKITDEADWGEATFGARAGCVQVGVFKSIGVFSKLREFFSGAQVDSKTTFDDRAKENKVSATVVATDFTKFGDVIKAIAQDDGAAYFPTAAGFVAPSNKDRILILQGVAPDDKVSTATAFDADLLDANDKDGNALDANDRTTRRAAAAYEAFLATLQYCAAGTRSRWSARHVNIAKIVGFTVLGLVGFAGLSAGIAFAVITRKTRRRR